MNDNLKQIFSNVLNIPLEEVNATTSPENTPSWDSMAHLNLISIAEEDLGIDIDPEDIPQMLKSYASFSNVVDDHLRK